MIYFEKCVFRLFMFHNYNGTVVITLTDISIETNKTNGYLYINLCNSKLAFMSSARHALCIQQNIEEYVRWPGRATTWTFLVSHFAHFNPQLTAQQLINAVPTQLIVHTGKQLLFKINKLKSNVVCSVAPRTPSSSP